MMSMSTTLIVTMIAIIIMPQVHIVTSIAHFNVHLYTHLQCYAYMHVQESTIYSSGGALDLSCSMNLKFGQEFSGKTLISYYT